VAGCPGIVYPLGQVDFPSHTAFVLGNVGVITGSGAIGFIVFTLVGGSNQSRDRVNSDT
jgi:hypothetical protein